MNKIMKNTAATTAIAAMLLVTHQVSHAEEVAAENVNSDATIASTVTAQEITKDDVEKAETAYNEAESAVESVQNDIDTAENIVEKLTTHIENATESIKEAENITKEDIDNAQMAVEKAKTVQTNSETALTEANSTLETTKQAKDAQETAYATAEKAVEDASNTLTNAQNVKETALEAANPEVIENAKHDVNIANVNVETAKSAVERAKVALNDAKAFDSELETNVSNAKTVMDEASVVKLEKETKAQELKLVSDKAQADLQKAQANDELYAGFPTDIKLDEGFVKAFKEWMDFYNDPATNTLFANNREEYNRRNKELRLKVLEAEMRVINSPENYRYDIGKSSKQSFGDPRLNKILSKVMGITADRMWENDGSHQLYDTKNLSTEIVEELNLYGIEVFNSIRAQFGLTPVKVNKNAMAMAGDIANEVEKANFTIADHYVEGIKTVAGKYGLGNSNNYYENLMTSYNTRMATKEELYTNVLMAMVGFFYEGHTNARNSYYGHARSLYNGVNGYGIGFSYTENADNGVFKVHVITAKKGATDPEILRTKWGNNAPYVLEPKSSDIATLKQKADEAFSNYARANGDLLSATTAYNAAKRTYDNVASAVAKTPKATTILTNAQKALDEALNDQATKVNRLKDLEANATNNQAALENATNAVNKARQNKKDADLALIAQKAKLQAATLAYENAINAKELAEKQVEEARRNAVKVKREFERLIGLTDNIEAKRTALETAKQQLAFSKEELAKAQDTLTKAVQVRNNAEKEWTTIKARYDMQELAKQPTVSENAKPDVESKEGSVAKPDVEKEEGLAAKPDVASEEGSATKPDVASEEGSVVKPDVEKEEGLAAKPDVEKEEGPVAKPNVASEEGSVVKPDVASEEGSAVKPDVASEEGSAVKPDVASKEGSVAKPDVESEEGSATKPNVATEEGLALALNVESEVSSAMKLNMESTKVVTHTNVTALPESGELSMAWFTVATISILASVGLALVKRSEEI